MARRQGKGARAKAKARRKASKRARKEARQAEYAAMAASGNNKKGKRNKKTAAAGVKHPQAYCGNLGCARCFSELANPWLANKNSCIYSRRFTSIKWK